MVNSYLLIDNKKMIDNYLIIKSMVYNSIISIVLKSNAYGTGLKRIAKMLFNAGCRNFWVFDIEEAYKLRQYIVNSNIYILSNCKKCNFPFLVKSRFISVINFNEKTFSCLNFRGYLIANFNSGLNRESIQVDNYFNFTDFMNIMTHLPSVNNKNYTINKKNVVDFLKIKKDYHNYCRVSMISSNSYEYIKKKHYCSVIRIGGMIYGISNDTKILKNTINIYAKVLYRKIISKNEYIGYQGLNYINNKIKIIILNVGYYNGYASIFTNKSLVFALGFYMPIIGKISMNYTIVNANHVPDRIFRKIDYVELIGDNININNLCNFTGINPRELLFNIIKCNKIIYTSYD